MKRLFSLFLAVVAICAWMGNAVAPTPDAVPQEIATTAGYMVHIDPATGEYTDKGGIAVELTAKELNSLSRSEQGLTTEDSPVSGKMVNLQGRFQHSQVIHVDADGNISSSCVSGQPHTHEHEGSDR